MSKITKLFVSPRTNAVFTRSQCASFSSEGLQIGHDPSSSEFHVELDSQKAFLKYSRKGNVIELEHTEVPKIFQGKGVGKLLAKEAFEYVAKNNLKMKIHCEYAEKVFNDNKEKYKICIV